VSGERDAFGIDWAERTWVDAQARHERQQAEEKALYAKRMREFEARREAERPRLTGAFRTLDAVDDPLARKILDLHGREVSYGSARCKECVDDDGDGYDWPCNTVIAVAEHYELDLREFRYFDWSKPL
jgi:hypothetical protein